MANPESFVFIMKKEMKKETAKPKGPRSAYNFFVQDYQKKLKERIPALSFADSSKICAVRWKHLPPKARGKYKKLAEEDFIRYRKEKERFSHEQTDRKKKRKKDPMAPLRPLSAYIWFCSTQWKMLADKNPNMNFMQMREEITRLWKECSNEKKKLYEAMALCDSECYKREKEIYARENARKPDKHNKRRKIK